MWNLYNSEKEFLEPLKFSNGKSQGDIVKEVLDLIKKGNKVIFIHGVCGTGKSAIALNIARKLGKTSIVVPGKNLQSQYKKDYENSKYLLKDNKEKLKISVITGRNNHKCRFLEDNKSGIPVIKKEENARLNYILEAIKGKVEHSLGKDESADNPNLPCKIEIREKNWNRIKEYLKQNNRINWRDFTELKDVKRMSIAPICPYWSPVMTDKYELKFSGNFAKRTYTGLNGKKFIFYQRKVGCPFYAQFNSYIDSDVIVFNSQKYKIETALNRKPETEVEIIDECDEFLDSFSNQRMINIDRLQKSLMQNMDVNLNTEERIKSIFETIQKIKNDEQISDVMQSGRILSLTETPIYELVKIFLSDSFAGEIDEESYVFDVEETAKVFEDVIEDVYLTFERDKEGKNLLVNLVTTNLAKKFAELRDKNKILVLMSGTLHSDRVLKDVFGIEEYKIIGAETEQQGEIEIIKTGLESDCKYSNFSSGKTNRETYLKALDKCVEVSKKPTLIHVNAFQDLPTEKDISFFNLKNLISREKVMEMQKEDKEGKIVQDFKNKEIDVLFTTRCTRGIDFPGEECNSIIFTKYPNPNVQDAFWKILKQTKPNYYWEFYNDKARRELQQRIYRGLRFSKDHIFLLSPDSRVLGAFEK